MLFRSVAALRHVGTKVGFSDVGPELSIAAPGGNCVNLNGACLYPILTTADSGTQGPVSSIYTDSFDASVGTSFSSPLVAATAALMLSAQPSLLPAAVRTALQSSARPFPQSGVAPDPVDGAVAAYPTAPSNFSAIARAPPAVLACLMPARRCVPRSACAPPLA